MLIPVLPLINERLGLKLAMAGFLGTILSVCNLTQPFMGLWGDRMIRRNLVVGGALMTAVFTPLLGLAPNYWTLAAVLMLGGMGVSAFHPQAFTLAGEFSSERRAFGIALFTFGGTLGIGFTPLWVPLFAENFGIRFLPLVSLPGIAAVVLIGRYLPLQNPSVQRVRFGRLLLSLRHKAAPLTLITAIVIFRNITFVGFGFFLTQLGRERGLTLVEGGIPLAIYNLSGVAGSLAAGYFADRYDARRIVWLSILLASPALLGFLHSEGPSGYFCLMLGGVGIMGSNSIMVAMAQEIAPENKALASSLPLGFSWGLASLSLPLVGHLADRIGLAGALHFLAILPLLTAGLAIFLPERRPIDPIDSTREWN